MNPLLHNLIIIGSGPAGLTAGIYAARSNLYPIIIEGPKPGGQLMGTSYVENWPGEKKILGPVLMANMRAQAQGLGCTIISQTIQSVNFSVNPFIINPTMPNELRSHCVIIATGATPKRLGCKGEDEYWGKGVTSCAVCDGPFYKDKSVVIVGGGDTAMEDASFMARYTDDITIIHIQKELTASAAMQDLVLREKKAKIIYSSTVTSIEGNGSHVTQVTVTNQQDNAQSTRPADVVFLAIGLIPNTHVFKPYLEMSDYGYLRLKNNTETSIKGIFGAGDVADDRYRQAITSAGAGCMAALDAERYLKTLSY